MKLSSNVMVAHTLKNTNLPVALEDGIEKHQGHAGASSENHEYLSEMS